MLWSTDATDRCVQSSQGLKSCDMQGAWQAPSQHIQWLVLSSRVSGALQALQALQALYNATVRHARRPCGNTQPKP